MNRKESNKLINEAKQQMWGYLRGEYWFYAIVFVLVILFVGC